MKVKLNNVRLAFAQNLFTAGTVGSDPKSKPAYSCTAILPPDHPQLAELEQAQKQVAKEKWADKADGILKSILATSDKMLVVNGDTKAQYDGFEGNLFISCRRQETDGRPTVVNRRGQPISQGDPETPYSGCYAVVHIDVWAQDNSYGKRINAQLLGVQFHHDGDSFGGGSAPAAPDDFTPLDASEEEDLTA